VFTEGAAAVLEAVACGVTCPPSVVPEFASSPLANPSIGSPSLSRPSWRKKGFGGGLFASSAVRLVLFEYLPPYRFRRISRAERMPLMKSRESACAVL
jgi:hypothetical protein